MFLSHASSSFSNPNVPLSHELRTSSAVWSWLEDKTFEDTIAEFGSLAIVNHMNNFINRIPTKNPQEILKHYEDLVCDVGMIESGLIPVPKYRDVHEAAMATAESRGGAMASAGSTRSSRKRGRPWTTEEHELFEEGLKQYGKGDWKSISRFVVKTKSPAQVASHAQKYFLRFQKPPRPRWSRTV